MPPRCSYPPSADRHGSGSPQKADVTDDRLESLRTGGSQQSSFARSSLGTLSRSNVRRAAESFSKSFTIPTPLQTHKRNLSNCRFFVFLHERFGNHSGKQSPPLNPPVASKYCQRPAC